MADQSFTDCTTALSPVTPRVPCGEAAMSICESALGQFGVSNLCGRIVAPPRPFPIETRPSSSDSDTDLIKKTFSAEFERVAWELITSIHMGVDKSAVRVETVARKFRDNPGSFKPTVLVTVDAPLTAEMRSEWEPVVHKLKCYIDWRIVATPTIRNLNVHVEIISKALTERKYLSPVPTEWRGYGKLQNLWSCISNGVINIIERYHYKAGHTASVSILRLGYSPVHSENAPTVYVSVDYDWNASDWSPVLEAMQEFVDHFELDLKVRIEPGECCHVGLFE